MITNGHPHGHPHGAYCWRGVNGRPPLFLYAGAKCCCRCCGCFVFVVQRCMRVVYVCASLFLSKQLKSIVFRSFSPWLSNFLCRGRELIIFGLKDNNIVSTPEFMCSLLLFFRNVSQFCFVIWFASLLARYVPLKEYIHGLHSISFWWVRSFQAVDAFLWWCCQSTLLSSAERLSRVSNNTSSCKHSTAVVLFLVVSATIPKQQGNTPLFKPVNLRLAVSTMNDACSCVYGKKLKTFPPPQS